MCNWENKILLTADLETEVVISSDCKRIQKPFLAALYDGKKVLIVRKQNQAEENFIKSFIDTIYEKYSGKNIIYVYFHNFSAFDGILLIHLIIQLGYIIKPIIKDKKIYEIFIKYKDVNIVMRDSYLHLTYSLRDLTEMFNTLTKKKDFE